MKRSLIIALIADLILSRLRLIIFWGAGDATLVTKQLLGSVFVFKTFQNGWILVEMLSFLLVVFSFFLVEFQLVFIHENQ